MQVRLNKAKALSDAVKYITLVTNYQQNVFFCLLRELRHFICYATSQT